MPAPSMKTNSIRNCGIDEFLHNLCKYSSKIRKNQCLAFLESLKKSNQDLIGNYLAGFVIADILNGNFGYNERTNSAMGYFTEDIMARDGLFPAWGSPLTISDTSTVNNLGPVTVESKPVGSEETVREDALENAKVNEHGTAANHCFLNDSSYFDQFTLGAGEFGAFNLRMAELDNIVKSKVQGFASELVFSSMITEDCFMLPSLEETTDEPFDQVEGFHGDFWTNLDKDLQSNVLNHPPDVCNQFAVDFGFMDSEEVDVVDPISFIRNFLDLYDLDANSLPALLSLETGRKRVTLVLDLDETLVHSTTKPCTNADFSFRIPVNMDEMIMYVRQRPFVKVFLERVSEMFEIILFTASQGSYAKLLLNYLDPEGKIFSRCAFRDSCVLADGIFTKDLSVLGIDLAKVAIVDNTPQVYRWQVNNGIPIKSWYDDPSDTELMRLLPFLEMLVNVDDVRPIIKQRFGGQGQ